jgi:hypothetical protein
LNQLPGEPDFGLGQILHFGQEGRRHRFPARGLDGAYLVQQLLEPKPCHGLVVGLLQPRHDRFLDPVELRDDSSGQPLSSSGLGPRDG